jgi:serine/threonine-protein kinase HipA
VQPKFLAMRSAAGYRPARAGETSTYIAKLPSSQIAGVVELEALTTVAAGALLAGDRVVEIDVAGVEGISGLCLMVKRFDRTPEGGKIHFEEFNQLLNLPAEAKYDGAYSDMAAFLRQNPRCAPADIDYLFRRVLACILLGNNDGHLKNFGVLYEGGRMRLTPVYDFLAVALYPEYNSVLALRIGRGANPRDIGGLGPKHVEELAKSFGLGRGALLEAVRDLGTRLDAAEEAVKASPWGPATQKERLIEYMRKRWNGTFRLIGRS